MQLASTRLATGPRLHYATAGEPDGLPLVLLHGWPDSCVSYTRVVEALPPGYRVLVPDQRGFGHSERPDGGYRITDLANDLIAFMDALGVERACVVGHSFGSFVARRAAVAHPDRITRLVLIGSGVSAANAVMREVLASLQDLPDRVPAAFARAFQASTIHHPLPQEFFDRLIEESLELPGRLWRELLAQLVAFDDADDLRRIEAPTLLLWGEHDALFTREDQEGLLAAIPRARLRVYADTGHCPNWERPALVAADLDAFVRERAGPARTVADHAASRSTRS